MHFLISTLSVCISLIVVIQAHDPPPCYGPAGEWCVETVGSMFSSEASAALEYNEKFYVSMDSHVISVHSETATEPFVGLNHVGGYADDRATQAKLFMPRGIGQYVDTNNIIFFIFADEFNHALRKIEVELLMVSTIAGRAPPLATSGFVDGDALTQARLYQPTGIDVVQGSNVVFFVEIGNNAVRQLHLLLSHVTTIAGQSGTLGYQDGIGLNAKFSKPRGVRFRGGGFNELYIADSDNFLLRKIDLSSPERWVSTIAGTSGSDVSQDGEGLSASFGTPIGLAFHAADTNILFVADSSTHQIRRVNLDEDGKVMVKTIAGSGQDSHGDGFGKAAHFSQPMYIAFHGTALFVTEHKGKRLRKVYAATATDPPASTVSPTPLVSSPPLPSGMTFAVPLTASPAPSISVVPLSTSPHITQFTPVPTQQPPEASTVPPVTLPETPAPTQTQPPNTPTPTETVGGLSASPPSTTSNVAQATPTAAAATFTSTVSPLPPQSCPSNGTTNFIQQYCISTLYSFTASSPQGVAIFKNHSFVSTLGHTIVLMRQDGGSSANLTAIVVAGKKNTKGLVDGVGSSQALFNSPRDIAVAEEELGLYIADSGNHVIRFLEMTGPAESRVSTRYGTPQTAGPADGVGHKARFDSPRGIALDAHTKSLLITEYSGNRVRHIDLTSHEVSTIAGQFRRIGFQDGYGSDCLFNQPMGVAVRPKSITTIPSSSKRRKHVDESAHPHETTGDPNSTIVGETTNNETTAAPSTLAPIEAATQLLIADQMNSCLRYVNAETKLVEVAAGKPFSASTLDGTGVNARFNKPMGITFRKHSQEVQPGSLLKHSVAFVAESGGHVIRRVDWFGNVPQIRSLLKVDNTFVVSTIIGTASQSGTLDGIAKDARVLSPLQLAAFDNGMLLLTTANYKLRLVTHSQGEFYVDTPKPSISSWTTRPVSASSTPAQTPFPFSSFPSSSTAQGLSPQNVSCQLALQQSIGDTVANLLFFRLAISEVVGVDITQVKVTAVFSGSTVVQFLILDGGNQTEVTAKLQVALANESHALIRTHNAIASSLVVVPDAEFLTTPVPGSVSSQPPPSAMLTEAPSIPGEEKSNVAKWLIPVLIIIILAVVISIAVSCYVHHTKQQKVHEVIEENKARSKYVVDDVSTEAHPKRKHLEASEFTAIAVEESNGLSPTPGKKKHLVRKSSPTTPDVRGTIKSLMMSSSPQSDRSNVHLHEKTEMQPPPAPISPLVKALQQSRREHANDNKRIMHELKKEGEQDDDDDDEGEMADAVSQSNFPMLEEEEGGENLVQLVIGAKQTESSLEGGNSADQLQSPLTQQESAGGSRIVFESHLSGADNTETTPIGRKETFSYSEKKNTSDASPLEDISAANQSDCILDGMNSANYKSLEVSTEEEDL